MRVLHLNTRSSGGAARAAIRLHEGLKAEGVSSRFAVAPNYQRDGFESPLCPAPDSRWIGPFRRFWQDRETRKRYSTLEPSTFHRDCRTKFRPNHLEPLLPADVIHLHWISDFLDWETCLPWLAKQAPLVWTLHDMNPFYGIWHYAPDVHEQSGPMQEWENEVRKIKSRTLSKIDADRITLVGPSRWVAERARESSQMGRFRTVSIPYGLHTRVFRPINKSVVREALGIPKNYRTVGFMAPVLKDPRKGYNLLLEALSHLAEKGDDLSLITVGPGAKESPDFPSLNLGRVGSDDLLRLFYAAIDCFVCPSLQEVFGQVITESMACGTPVIGFESGGIPEIICPGETGWLVPTGDTRALAQTIEKAVSDPILLRSYGQNCRGVATEEYSLGKQASAYQKLYEEILERVSRSTLVPREKV
ncbi:MAG: glycosyltransferase [Verrucomicrobiota bacterium]